MGKETEPVASQRARTDTTSIETALPGGEADT